jgi:2-amino-4-hydroxy-6-hydroxymethyldihydropteridine diphosphokinase
MQILIGLGSNMGDRESEINSAIDFLSGFGGIQRAPWYVSPPYGFASKLEFINTAVLLDTEEEPVLLLKELLGYEEKRGRERIGAHTDRPIDLDILMVEDKIIDEPGLKVPHPEMHRRSFVIRPAADLCGSWVHPLLKKDLGALLNECSDDSILAPYAS